MNRKTAFLPFLLLLLIGSAGPAAATLLFDQDVHPDVIFGNGNANGAFTVDRSSGLVELGLRAKLRFDENNQPQNIFNSNHDGTYSFTTGSPTGGPGWVTSSTPLWNFEWTVNVDFESNGMDEGSGWQLDDLTYEIGIDFDPTAGVEDYLIFDPIRLPDVPPTFFWDNAIGDNSTGNGGGTYATDRTDYAALIGANNVAQNSWNMEFFNDGYSFDPNAVGEYRFYLSAANSSEVEVGRTEMTVLVGTPEPGAAGILALLLGCVGAVRVVRRKLRHA